MNKSMLIGLIGGAVLATTAGAIGATVCSTPNPAMLKCWR